MTVAGEEEMEMANWIAAGSEGAKNERDERRMMARTREHCLQHREATSERSMV
jgi:hypothetical protein